jgi:predicted dehydrogenase
MVALNDGVRRIGIIGLDSSHAPELVRYFNERDTRWGRVTAAWAGGSPDAPLSAERVAGFTAEVRDQLGVAILATPEEVAAECDALLLLAMDGRTHAALFERVAPAGRPVFINKPLATSFAETERIFRVGAKHNAPWFSASAVRYATEWSPHSESITVTCPLWFEPANAGWFWYGVHGVELMCQLMGRGIASVRVAVSTRAELLTARWRDGREACVEGILSRDAPFSVVRNGGAAEVLAVGMSPLAALIGGFFRNARPPVTYADMSEVVCVLEAANLSRARGGVEITL